MTEAQPRDMAGRFTEVPAGDPGVSVLTAPPATPICTPACWTPVRCPEHGDDMPPFGRSAPIEYPHCCDRYADSALNRRHLWNEHDSTRIYTDPEGWRQHVAGCSACAGEGDDE